MKPRTIWVGGNPFTKRATPPPPPKVVVPPHGTVARTLAVLGVLRNRRKATVAQIMEDTGLFRTTVRHILDEAVAFGWVLSEQLPGKGCPHAYFTASR